MEANEHLVRIHCICKQLKLPQFAITHTILYYEKTRKDFFDVDNIVFEQTCIFLSAKYKEVYRAAEDIILSYRDLYSIKREAIDIIQCEIQLVIKYKLDFDFVPDVIEKLEEKIQIFSLSDSISKSAHAIINDSILLSDLYNTYTVDNILFACILLSMCIINADKLIVDEHTLYGKFKGFTWDVEEIKGVLSEILCLYQRESELLPL